ncbi:MAG: hypothetical protein EHM46_06510 [Bacteroidetes bacterium]|nr:MAG: hypothetical protein EHM46_06510 [Bacteroidota bacterium]
MLTPVVCEDLLYTVDSKNMMRCIDAATGEVVWSERAKGKYNSSPVCAGGHIYFCSTRGETLVLKAGRIFDPVSVNRLEGEIWATPAIAESSILVRTSEYLYRIGGS